MVGVGVPLCLRKGAACSNWTRARTRRDGKEALVSSSLWPTLGAQGYRERHFCIPPQPSSLPLFKESCDLYPKHWETEVKTSNPTNVATWGFEDDHGNRPFRPLGSGALENRVDLGLEIGLLFGSDAGDHGASRACDRDAYPGLDRSRWPAGAGHRRTRPPAPNCRWPCRPKHRRACLTRPATDSTSWMRGMEGLAEDPSQESEDPRVYGPTLKNVLGVVRLCPFP